MDEHMVYSWCLMVFVSFCRAAPVSENFAVLAGSPVSVQRGLTATLPCWLAPYQSAEDLEVRWYRGSDQYDTPVMLYKSKMFDRESQKASYAGRVDFGFKDPTSGGLKSGDVSLKLKNVTIEDAGNYTCLVSSFKEFESSSVSLRVTEMGSLPILSVVWTKDNMVNLSCESEGWYPQPELRWLDRNDKELATNNLVKAKDPAGLFSVHSWLLVPDSFDMSCSVGLSKKETETARMRLGSPQRSLQEESGSSSAGWVVFGILLIALAALAVAAALYFKWKAQSKPEGDKTDVLGQVEKVYTCKSDSVVVRAALVMQAMTPPTNQLVTPPPNRPVTPPPNQPVTDGLLMSHFQARMVHLEPQPKGTLMNSCEEKELLLPIETELSNYYVNVTFVDTNNPLLTIKGSKLRDAANQIFPDGDRVTCCTAVRGTPGFSSGRHYWEVSLSLTGAEPKKSWWIGVANTEIPKHASFTPNTSNGFWFLSSSPKQEAMVRFSTEPKTYLPVQSPLKTVGVFLNYEDGELSFYDVDNESLIGSLASKFTGEVFPVFNPGKFDESPMEIIQKVEKDPVTNDNKHCNSAAQELY